MSKPQQWTLTELTTIKITKTMKKYLYLFFVALFATMSFTLTSCGDDDDEPNGGNTTSALTINGKKYNFNDFFSQLQKRYDNRTMLWCQIDDSEGNELDVNLYNWDSVTDGYVYSSNDEDIAIAWDDNTSCGHEIYGFTSGNVKVVSVKQDANLVTLSFNNAKFVCDQDNSTVTINGNLTMPIKGHMYNGEMYD